MFVSKSIIQDFEIWDGYKQIGDWVIELRQKEDKISKELVQDKAEVA